MANPWSEVVSVIHKPDYGEYHTCGIFKNFDEAERALTILAEQVKGKLEKWNESDEYKQYIIKEEPHNTGYYSFIVEKTGLNSLKIDMLDV